jgi:hypothetical protein
MPEGKKSIKRELPPPLAELGSDREVETSTESLETSSSFDAVDQDIDSQKNDADILRREVKEEPLSAAPVDPIVVELESILAGDLTDLYLNLPADVKPVFKARGEEIAMAVNEMIITGKIRTKKILEMVRAWLRLVPGINRFFLDQEAKIKTDAIIIFIDSQEAPEETQNDI